jgi:hypothetical protein
VKSELRPEAELGRYAEAIADVGPLATILQAVKVREQRRDAIRTRVSPRRAASCARCSSIEFKGEASLSGLIAGLICASSVVAPTGRNRTCIIQVRDFIAR